MRWLLCLFLCATARADYTLNLDSLAAGDSANDATAASYGVSLAGLGDGGPFAVIADAPCAGEISPPNVFSFHDVADCPETNNLSGFFEVNFEVDQSFVSVRVLHSVAGTASYLMAFSGPNSSDFIDQTYGDGNIVGTPQTLRIERTAQQSQIRRVRFGVFNLDSYKAAFDDLTFPNVPVAITPSSWSALRARW